MKAVPPLSSDDDVQEFVGMDDDNWQAVFLDELTNDPEEDEEKKRER